MPETGKPYVYQPLPGTDWIRILQLWPGSVSDELRGQLVCIRLRDQEAYETVSYTWRGPGKGGTLELDGQALWVNSNCNTALRNLRRPHKSRKAWIDAVCVNQTDKDEKEAQVKMMGEIYARASRTVVYLGPGDGTVMLLSSQSLLSNIGAGVTPSHRLELEDARTRLLARPWYQRKWIVQEVLLSRDLLVRAGAHEFTWSELEAIDSNHTLDVANLAAKYLHPSSRAASPTDGKIGRSAERIAYDQMYERGEVVVSSQQRLESGRRAPGATRVGFLNSSQWFDLLCLTSEFKCSEPRDRIYALRALFDEQTEFEPDYTCSDEDVYFRLTKELLGLGDTRMLWLDDRVSWNVRWETALSTLSEAVRRKGEVNIAHRGPTDIGRSYADVLHERRGFKDLMSCPCRHVWTPTGVHIGRIKAISPQHFEACPAQGGVVPYEGETPLEWQWHAILRSVASEEVEPTKNPRQISYRNTTVGVNATEFEEGLRPLSYVHERNRGALPWFRNWTMGVFTTSVYGKEIEAPTSDNMQAIKNATRRHHGNISFCKGMRLFSCFNALLGLADPTIEEGDHIFFLPGHTCPFFVLRPLDKQFEFITLCWLGPLKLFPSIVGKDLKRFKSEDFESLEII